MKVITTIMVVLLLNVGSVFAMSPEEKRFDAALIMTQILAFPQYTAQYCEKTLTPEQNKQFTVLVREWNVRHSAEFLYSTLTIYDLTNTRSLGSALEKILLKSIELQRSELNQNMKAYCNEQMSGYKEVQSFTLWELLELDPNEESRKYKKQAYKFLFGGKK